jgi:hypothetical protein
VSGLGWTPIIVGDEVVLRLATSVREESNFIASRQGGFLDYYVCDSLGFGIEVGFRLLVSWNGQAWGLVGALHVKRRCCVTIFEV